MQHLRYVIYDIINIVLDITRIHPIEIEMMYLNDRIHCTHIITFFLLTRT